MGTRQPAAGTAKVRGARVPDGVRVYAIGDIHGRVDLLDLVLARVADDARRYPDVVKVLITLGDYIDRGPWSREVLDRLSELALPDFRVVALMGNHEEAMLGFLGNVGYGPHWINGGGSATLASYGLPIRPETTSRRGFLQLQHRLRATLPEAHITFLQNLQLSCVVGDYFFVHAGVRPGVALDSQAAEDLLWIREDFLKSAARFGKVVVHGHTITERPQCRSNRIGIDTGAFATNRLTCLVLAGDEYGFMTVESALAALPIDNPALPEAL